MDKEKLKKTLENLTHFERNIEYSAPKFPGVYTMENGGVAFPILASALRTKTEGFAVVYGRNVDSAIAAGMLKKYAEHLNAKAVLIQINSERSTFVTKRKFPLDISLVIVLVDKDTEIAVIENRKVKPFPIIYISTNGEGIVDKSNSMTVSGKNQYTLSSMTTILLNAINMVPHEWFVREIMSLNAVMIIYGHKHKEIYGENEYLLYYGLKQKESLKVLDTEITGDLEKDLKTIEKYVRKFNRFRGERLFYHFPNKVSAPVISASIQNDARE